MNNIAKLRCMHFWSDWTDIKEIEINLDEYVFFEIDYRGQDSWHIIGNKCDNISQKVKADCFRAQCLPVNNKPLDFF